MCVVPILTTEVWGCKIHNFIENVHVKFCKKQMVVGNRANSTAVRRKCGRHKIEIACLLKCLKYWIKIVQMPENCLVKACYSMLVNKCNSGVTNWASRVRDILYKHGYVWEAQLQSFIEVNTFLYEFSLTIIDSKIQMWNTEVAQQPRLIMYRQFKHVFEPEACLSFGYVHVLT